MTRDITQDDEAMAAIRLLKAQGYGEVEVVTAYQRLLGEPTLHLFEHDDAGFYAAETVDEATSLLIADAGVDPSEAEGFEAISDDTVIPVVDGDTGQTERRTAFQWANMGKKGYRFGGDY